MKDRFGREIDYLRISVTDRCNLKCVYCMPEACPPEAKGSMLDDDDLLRIVRIAAGTGIVHFRLTGGEPLLRPDLSRLIGAMKMIPGVQTVTVTTNGTLLYGLAGELAKAGTDGINVSLDTTDRAVFAGMTGASDDGLTPQAIIEGIDRALSCGIPVKTNTVLTAVNRDGWYDIVQLARERAIDVRFIELMPIGCCKGISGGVSNSELLAEMEKILGKPGKCNEKKGNGPAIYYDFPGLKGSIGFISAIHGKFCKNCNRLRLTAAGELKPCLCFDDGIDLHDMIADGADDSDIAGAFSNAVLKKPLGHCFEKPDLVTERRSMVQIGG